MSYIEDIRTTEEKAQETVSAAEKEAAHLIEDAKTSSQKEIDALREELKQETQAAMDAQKQELAQRYRKITQKGEEDAEEIRSGALLRKKEATQFIIDELIKS